MQKQFLLLLPACLALLASLSAAREAQTMHEATGTFTVSLAPLPAEIAGSHRLALTKTFSGDLAGTSAGQMINAGDPGKGEAGYVALEMVEASIGGRSGSFAMQHSGTITGGKQHLHILIVPGSGTGALAGISGSMAIVITGGAHHYTLSYAVPPQP